MGLDGSHRAIILSPPHDRDSYRSGESLGLRYVAAALDRAGVPVEVLQGCRRPLDQEASNTVAGAALVGIGVLFTRQLPAAIQLAREIRSRFRVGHITCGGQGVSFLWERILLDCPEIDSVCAFESEETVVDLWDRVSIGQDAAGVRGLYYRDGDRIASTGFRAPVEDLDTLPFPYRAPGGKVFQGHAALCGSRGCSARCRFCQSGNFGNPCRAVSRWRCRSAQDIFQELSFLVRRCGVTSVSFIDDDFFGGDGRGSYRAHALAELIRGAGLDVTFSIGCRVDEIDIGLLGELRDAGLRHVLIGVESGIQRDIGFYGKNIDASRTGGVLHEVRRSGLSVSIGFIMYHPESTIRGIAENIDFLEANDLVSHRSITNRLELYPGSPLIEILGRRGIRFHEDGYRSYYDFKDSRVHAVYSAMARLLRPFQGLEERLEDLLFVTETGRSESSDLPIAVANASREAKRALVECSRLCLAEPGHPEELAPATVDAVRYRLEEVRTRLNRELSVFEDDNVLR